MFEKMVPLSKKNILGSTSSILLFENRAQIVVIVKSDKRGYKGRAASVNVRIFPVLSLYDLKIGNSNMLVQNFPFS